MSNSTSSRLGAALFSASGLIVFIACGSSSSGGNGGTSCAPGISQSCVGAGGCAGGQVCKQDGSGFGACDCGSGSDGGSHDGSAQDSSGGMDATPESGGSDGTADGSGDAGGDGSNACNSGADCTTCGDNVSCVACCETAHMSGSMMYLAALSACACVSPGSCMIECKNELCVGQLMFPAPNSPCDNCVGQVTFLQACNGTMGAQNCAKDADCMAFTTCLGKCPP